MITALRIYSTQPKTPLLPALVFFLLHSVIPFYGSNFSCCLHHHSPMPPKLLTFSILKLKKANCSHTSLCLLLLTPPVAWALMAPFQMLT